MIALKSGTIWIIKYSLETSKMLIWFVADDRKLSLPSKALSSGKTKVVIIHDCLTIWRENY